MIDRALALVLVLTLALTLVLALMLALALVLTVGIVPFVHNYLYKLGQYILCQFIILHTLKRTPFSPF